MGMSYITCLVFFIFFILSLFIFNNFIFIILKLKFHKNKI